jgi:hypothetical protein
MAAKLTRLTHKKAIQLHLAAESSIICSGQSGNFWLHPCISTGVLLEKLLVVNLAKKFPPLQKNKIRYGVYKMLPLTLS